MTDKYLRDALILWATIDPIGTLVLFLSLTTQLSAGERRKIAGKAVLYAGSILVVSILVGQVLLSAMQINLLSLQLAGGVILFLFGIKMLFGPLPAAGPEPGHDVAVFPLAVPSIASPGSIMAVILLTDNQIFAVPVQVGTTAILLAILVATYLALRLATPIYRVIGKNGAAILTRIMAMLLTALSVELVMRALGVDAWLQGADHGALL